MALQERTPDRRERKRFLVECDGCSLEQTADGREEAKRVADDHQEETEHELVVVEWPRSTAPP